MYHIFAVSAQFIWVVEINGVENSDINGIISTLDSIGIKSGALKANCLTVWKARRRL